MSWETDGGLRQSEIRWPGMVWPCGRPQGERRRSASSVDRARSRSRFGEGAERAVGRVPGRAVPGAVEREEQRLLVLADQRALSRVACRNDGRARCEVPPDVQLPRGEQRQPESQRGAQAWMRSVSEANSSASVARRHRPLHVHELLVVLAVASAHGTDAPPPLACATAGARPLRP